MKKSSIIICFLIFISILSIYYNIARLISNSLYGMTFGDCFSVISIIIGVVVVIPLDLIFCRYAIKCLESE